jgi:hypothetical protein
VAGVRAFARRVVVCVACVAAGASGACGSKGGKSGSSAAAARDAGPKDPYLAALAPLARLEGEALDGVAAHLGDKYTSDDDLLAALQKTAIPRYQEFVAGLARLTPPAERTAQHQKLLTLAQRELAALQHLADAVSHGDGNTVLAVNREQRQLGDEIDALLAAWNGGASVPPAPAPPAQAASTSSSDANTGSK